MLNLIIDFCFKINAIFNSKHRATLRQKTFNKPFVERSIESALASSVLHSCCIRYNSSYLSAIVFLSINHLELKLSAFSYRLLNKQFFNAL